ncbi:MAG: hypothetical protein VKJ06_02715 [Vampirovibrionales bacterium]|nr:hypothetical protein [Vampirovibrionales bacterium]
MNRLASATLCLLSGVLILCTPSSLAADPRQEDQLNAARRYAQAQQWDYAAYAWRLLLEESPSNSSVRTEAWLGLAQALDQTGAKQEAELVLQEALSQLRPPNENRLPLYSKLGELMTSHGQWIRATELYEQALAEFPLADTIFLQLKSMVPNLPPYRRRQVQQSLKKTAQTMLKQAWQATDAQDYAAASQRFDLVIAYEANDIKLINNAALAALLAGDWDHAMQVYMQLQGKRGIGWPMYAAKALIDLAAGDTRQAELNTRRAIGMVSQSNSDFHKAGLYNQLGYVLEQGDNNTKSRFAFERALEIATQLQPKTSAQKQQAAQLKQKIQINLAYTQQKSDQYKDAIATYTKLLKQTNTPRTKAELWQKLGFVYELNEQDSKAEQAYKSAVAADTTYPDAYMSLAMLYKRQDKLSKSTDMLKALAALDFDVLENKLQTPVANAPRRIREQPGYKLLDIVDVYWLSKPAPQSVRPQAAIASPAKQVSPQDDAIKSQAKPAGSTQPLTPKPALMLPSAAASKLK